MQDRHYILRDVHIIHINGAIKRDHYVEVKEGKIKTIGKMPVPKEQCHLPVISGDNNGLTAERYNTHAHTPMTLLRGVADDVPLQVWLEKEIWPREALLDKEAVMTGTSLALAEMIRSGTVAFLDMYHLHMDKVFETTLESGIKAVLSRGMIAFGTEEEQEAKRKEAVRFANEWNEYGAGRMKGMLFPHAPYTCPPSFLEKVVEEAAIHELKVGIHVAETEKECQDHLKKYHKRPITHLAELGFLERDAILTHVVHVGEEEWPLLASSSVTVSHNPMSNLKLGSGIAPVTKMKREGIDVTFGTDSTASNNNLDMFEEMRIACLLQKGVFQQPEAIEAKEVFQMATINGAKALGFGDDGLIQEGAPADFILIDKKAFHLQPEQNIFSHLVYSASGHDVTDVFVDGVCLMRKRELQTLDEEKIYYEANRSFKQLEEKKQRGVQR